jgi:hypothetical protein
MRPLHRSGILPDQRKINQMKRPCFLASVKNDLGKADWTATVAANGDFHEISDSRPIPAWIGNFTETPLADAP